MSRGRGGSDLVTLEPLLDAVREGVEQSGWKLSGLQKTTSHEFEGRWAGESTRSGYLFFHRGDLPGSVSVEAFLDETSRGLRGNLSLVLDGPSLGSLGGVPAVLHRVVRASAETLPEGYQIPVALRVGVPEQAVPADEAEVQFRIKFLIPDAAMEAGCSAVSALASGVVVAFERLLERPEVAELLPPVVE